MEEEEEEQATGSGVRREAGAVGPLGAETPRATSELSAGRSHTAGREGGGASEGVSLSRWLPQCGEEPPRPFLGPRGPFCPSRGHVHLTNEGRRCGWFSKAIKTPVEGEFSFSLSTRLEILLTL